MNNERRKMIATLVSDLEELKGAAESIQIRLEELREQEEEYRDGIPEPFTEKLEKAEEAVSKLEEAESCVQDVVDYIGTAVASLEEAAG